MPAYNRLLAALELVGGGDPCSGAPSIVSVTASTASNPCASHGVTHTGEVDLSDVLRGGLKLQWEVYTDEDSGWRTPSGGAYTSPGGTVSVNTDLGLGGYDTAGTDGGPLSHWHPDREVSLSHRAE